MKEYQKPDLIITEFTEDIITNSLDTTEPEYPEYTF